MSVQMFFTALELAEIAKAAGDPIGFPKSERGVQKSAHREQWNDLYLPYSKTRRF